MNLNSLNPPAYTKTPDGYSIRLCHIPGHTTYFLTGKPETPKDGRAWHCAICAAGPGNPETRTEQEILSPVQEIQEMSF